MLLQYSLWSGFCYVTPLLGGWAADSFLGRYRAILLFSSIYVLGLALLVVGVIPVPTTTPWRALQPAAFDVPTRHRA